MPEVDPHLEVIDEWTRAGIRLQVSMAKLPEVFGPTYAAVSEAVTAAGGEIVGPAYACYFGEPTTDEVDLEIGFGIKASIESSKLNVTGVPKMEAAVGVHLGSYDKLADSYEKLMPWLAEQDLALADQMYEFYDTMPEDQAEAVTRLVFPLA